MKKQTVIEFAKKRFKHACAHGEDDYIVQYWRAYLDGAESQRKEDENGLEQLGKMLQELNEQIEELSRMIEGESDEQSLSEVR